MFLRQQSVHVQAQQPTWSEDDTVQVVKGLSSTAFVQRSSVHVDHSAQTKRLDHGLSAQAVLDQAVLRLQRTSGRGEEGIESSTEKRGVGRERGGEREDGGRQMPTTEAEATTVMRSVACLHPHAIDREVVLVDRSGASDSKARLIVQRYLHDVRQHRVLRCSRRGKGGEVSE